MKRRLTAAALLLGLGLALAAAPARAQCSMCQTALTGSAEGRGIGAQFNRAILLMFVAPYLVFGCFVLAAFRREIGRRLLRRLARREVLGSRPLPRPHLLPH